jgi:hypothetical protein
MAGIQTIYRIGLEGIIADLQGQPMFYEGFSNNMKRELIASDIGTLRPIHYSDPSQSKD